MEREVVATQNHAPSFKARHKKMPRDATGDFEGSVMWMELRGF
jgi:hypothetical protein